MRFAMKIMRWVLLLATIMLVCLYSLLSFLIGNSMWPIDIASKELRLVQRVDVPGDGLVAVLQEWNHGDFYNTYLMHIKTDVHWVHLLDPDDDRMTSSDVRLEVASGQRIVSVYLEGTKAGDYESQSHDFVFAPGSMSGERVEPMPSGIYPIRAIPKKLRKLATDY